VSPPRHVFVGGLHRSGTSLVHRLLGAHPDVSGFAGTGVWEDEGQHLQSLVPPARAIGGPGRFGWDPEAHLTEDDLRATPEGRSRVLSEWSPHWDLARPVLVEKSPTNIVRFRFLQALFPEAAFVAVVRHPIAVALSTRRMRRLYRLRSVASVVEHWLRCQELFAADRPSLRRVHVVRLEQLCARPQETIEALQTFLELPHQSPAEPIRPDPDRGWERLWRSWRHPALLRRRLVRFEDRSLRWGYSLRQFGAEGPQGR
jgi:hypothetical protein